jgi:hypothetical protein
VFMYKLQVAGSMLPDAFHGNAYRGVWSMMVSTHLPSKTAEREEPLPRWQR